MRRDCFRRNLRLLVGTLDAVENVSSLRIIAVHLRVLEIIQRWRKQCDGASSVCGYGSYDCQPRDKLRKTCHITFNLKV